MLASRHGVVSRSVQALLSGGRVTLGLFKGVETWAKARGAWEVLLNVTSGGDSDDELYGSFGFHPLNGGSGKDQL